MKAPYASVPLFRDGERSSRGLASLVACCGALGVLGGCESEPRSHVLSAPPPPAPTRTAVTTSNTTAPVVVSATPMVVSTPSGTMTDQGYSRTQAVMPTQTLIVVTQTPPAPQQEPVLARPSPDHRWLPGYWSWRNENYEWISGHWELPPTMGAVWVPPRWEQQGNAYRFYEGYWN